MSKNLNQQERNSNPQRILLKIPVPWVFVLRYIVGLVPQFIFPVAINSKAVLSVIKIAGVSFFAIGALIASWPLITLFLVLIYVNLIVIPLEEEILKGDYREEYINYCTRVRRWL